MDGVGAGGAEAPWGSPWRAAPTPGDWARVLGLSRARLSTLSSAGARVQDPSGEGWHGALNPDLGSPDPPPELLGPHTVGRLE